MYEAQSKEAFSQEQLINSINTAIASLKLKGKSLLFVIPDASRSFPFKALLKSLNNAVTQGDIKRADMIIALGTHEYMSEREISQMFEVGDAKLNEALGNINIFNHNWKEASAFKHIGRISAKRSKELSGGFINDETPVLVNKAVYEYDKIIIAGPVFPHEVVGFSGGTKYLFPGLGSSAFTNLFHWYAALIGTQELMGEEDTPVRALIDEASDMTGLETLSLSFVLNDAGVFGLFAAETRQAWRAATGLSKTIHIRYKGREYGRVLALCPKRYDEIWTAGKCGYKTQGIVRRGGSIIIYAPHIKTISKTHGRLIKEIGYHCAEYFLNDPERFMDYPAGVLAHSAHLSGKGKIEGGRECKRIETILATGISEELCKGLGLGYINPKSININEYENDEDALVIPEAGNELYKISSRSI